MADRMTLTELDEHLRKFQVAMLATITSQGAIHARPMMTQERAADGDLWFVSALDTEKIAEIRHNPHVCAIYFRDSDNAYVSLSGEASISEDRQLLRQKWHESWRPWFPEGPDQANLCMIKVKAQEVELWEPEGGILRTRLDIARAYLTGDQARMNPPQEAAITPHHVPPEPKSA